MQAPHACRHCSGETVPDTHSYAAVLLRTRIADLRSAIEALEATCGIHSYLTFVCMQCQRVSVLSFAFHCDVTARADVPAYRTAAEYYTAAACRLLHGQQHEQRREEDGQVHACA
jgi:hypothetical protein